MKLKGLLITVITLLSLLSLRTQAQVDTIFWFAAPEVAASHADRPIYLRMSADNRPSNVTISIPARGIIIQNTVVNYGVSTTIDLTAYKDSLENATPNKVRNWGILITASEPITAYYEVNAAVNTDIWVLKGNNALGTKFITPFQTRYNNNSGFNGEAWSSADIVATENNTTITITPSTDVIGHKKGIPYTITLDRGQTYSIRDSLRTKTPGNLSGTLITSNKKIAVSVKDDSIEVPGLIQNYNDVIGDQLMGFENVGREYIVIKGDLNPNDYIYIVGTENGTNLNINGVASVINAYQTVEAKVTANIYISSDKPVYAWHLTGSEGESGGAILPAITCTGSPQIAFTRATANKAYLLVAVPTTGINNFVFNGSTTAVPASAFTAVPFSGGWSAAKIDLTSTMIVGSNFLKNTQSLFHMALINGDNGSGGSCYGYFSNYKVQISAGKDTTICRGSSIVLPDPGVYYNYEYAVVNGDPNSISNKNQVKPDSTTTYVLRRLGSCPTTDTVTVTINNIKADAGLDTTLCVGKARVGGKPAATGGYTPYTYAWNSGQTVDSAIVGVGKYWLTVTDKMGCKHTDTVDVKLGSGTTLTPGMIKPSCFGDSDGKAYLQNITGGAPPFTKKWQNGATTDTITVPAGTYKVVVTDRYGCTDSANVVVTQPARLDIDTVVTAASCPMVQNGKVVCSASGGTPAYQYARDNGAYASNGTFTPLAGGSYLFRVKDSKGCKDSASVTITVNNPPVVVAPNDTMVCPSSQLLFSGSSSTPGLTYIWTGGITNGIPFNASTNFTYVVTGKDAAGCTGKDSTAVTIKTVPNPKITTLPAVICSDTANIQLSAATPGGTWRGAGVSPSGVFNPSSAGPGTWQITYEVNNGCSDTDTVFLTVTKRLDASISPAGPFCTTASVQQLTPTQSGGTWSGTGVNSSGQFNPGVAGSGTHYIKYSLSGTCPDKDSIAILVNSYFDPTIIKTGPYCASDDTVILSSVTPGALWTGPGINGQNAENQGIFDPHLAGPGTHTITHTIGGSCGGTDTEQITVLPLDTARIQFANDSLCYNSSPMQLSADKAGGTWSGSVSNTGLFDPAGKAPGTYTVYYTYVQHCAHTDSLSIVITDTLKASLVDDTVSCFGTSDGVMNVIVANGTTPLSYTWTDDATVSTGNRSGLGTGSYTVTVTDGLACSDVASAKIYQPAVLAFVTINPLDDSCYHANKGSVSFVNSGGTPASASTPYSYTLSPVAGTLNSNGNGFSGLGAANYTVTATDKNGCSVTGTFTINEPAPLLIYTSTLPDYCGQSIGSCQVDSTTGGTPGYSLSWTNGPTTATYPARPGGNYTVTATDFNGCKASQTATVQNIAGPTQTLVIDSVSCNGYNDGKVTSTASGGTGTISYFWSDAALNVNQRTNFKAGTGYWVEITDTKNCTQKTTFDIKEPNKLKMVQFPVTKLCYGIPFTGTFATTGGNNGAHSYFLNSASHQANYSLNTAGNYSVYATDSKGCYSDTFAFTLNRDQDIEASLNPDPKICRFDTAHFICQASKGNGNFQYKWDNEAPGSQKTKDYITNASTQTPTAIRVIVSDGCSRPDTVDGKYELYEDPKATVTVGPDEGCYPLTVNFGIVSNLDQFTITNSDGSLLGYSNTFNYTFEEEGTYHPLLDGVTIDGCKLHLTSISPIKVYGYPTANFYWLPETPTTVDNQVQLKNTSVGANSSYWTGLDTNQTDTVFISNLNSPIWDMPAEAGNYPIQLVVTNEFGCSDTITQIIVLAEEITVYAANTFTPNEDGYNEVFVPIFGSENITNYKFQVFDRWGQEIFSSTDLKQAWDGNFNGNPCKVDVYPYRLSFTQGGTTKKKLILGRINLIR